MATGFAIASSVAAASAIGSTVINASAQRKQAKAEQAMAQYNNQLAEQRVQTIREESNEATIRAQREKRAALAEINAQAGASGVVMEGSPLVVLGAVGQKYETSIQDEARRAQIEMQDVRRQAQIGQWESQQRVSGLRTQTGGTILSGFGQLGSIGSNYVGMSAKTTQTKKTTK
ncbi:MAG: hypothetical protein RR553_07785 [Akkermansia sp.]